jgi:hypothetical protein
VTPIVHNGFVTDTIAFPARCHCPIEREVTRDRRFDIAPDAGGGWPAWSQAMGRLLDQLAGGPTHFVVITQEPNHRYVQLMVGHRRVHIEASSNAYLRGDFRLSPSEEELLQTLGFRPPEESFDGFPDNWWVERPFTWVRSWPRSSPAPSSR